MLSMFSNDKSLRYLNVNNFKTEKVNTMAFMFSHCESLTSLDLSSFDTSRVTSMFDMFYNDKSLLKLNLKNFNTEKTKEFGQFLFGCTNQTLYLGKKNDIIG